MSTFQGFKIAEIDRNKSPDFTSEDIYFKRLYFVLEPIDGCADVERQKVWGFSFRWMVKNWKRYPELNDYEETLEEQDLRSNSYTHCAPLEREAWTHRDAIDISLLWSEEGFK